MFGPDYEYENEIDLIMKYMDVHGPSTYLCLHALDEFFLPYLLFTHLTIKDTYVPLLNLPTPRHRVLTRAAYTSMSKTATD